MLRTSLICPAFSSNTARAFYSTKSVFVRPAPTIPTPAPALSLFPTLDAVPESAYTLVQATPEKTDWYSVSRTRGNQLPVYADVRANGHRTTIIRRIEGSLPLLKRDLLDALSLDKDRIKIKPVSNQIVITGDYVKQVRALFRQANL
ncbi:hypothetical protein D0Z03_001075 [Geotrichum reessii]|nr:hypothetical protein D0Z03_001075 [Galactomyces reessii]